MSHPAFHVLREASAATTSRGRILLISCHFPPSAGVGARRWAQMVHQFNDLGVAFDVVTLPPDELPITDPEALHALPERTRVVAVPMGEIPLVPRLSRWAKRWRGASASGAAGAGASDGGSAGDPAGIGVEAKRSLVALANWWRGRRWSQRVAAVTTALRRDAPYACVISSGPPHEAHLAAATIARHWRLPLVLDLRDPWANWSELLPDLRCRLGLWLAQRGERHCVSQAQLVVANNPVAAHVLASRHPRQAAAIVAVMNGADGEVRPPSAPAHPFRIAFAGSLYQGRDPRILFRAVRIAIDRLALTPSDIEIAFAGDATYDGVPLADLARECEVDVYFRYVGRLDHDATTRFLEQAHVLVSLPQDSPLCVPAKLFEYAQYHAWLLAFADAGTATAAVFADSGAGIVAERDVDAAAAQLVTWIRRHQHSEIPPAVNAAGRYSRERQFVTLLEAMRRVIPSLPRDDAAIESDRALTGPPGDNAA